MEANRNLNLEACQRSKHGEYESSASSWYLPPELVLQILARLPVKSLCRFRCVSPSWNSIFSDPEFADLQFEYSTSRPKLLITVHHKASTFCTASPAQARPLDDGSVELEQPETVVLQPPQKHWPQSYRPFSQSVGGLICIWFNTVTIGIYNPSTRESITDIDVPRLVEGCRAVGGSFGYDPVGKTHKVLGTWSRYNTWNGHGPRRVSKYRVLALDGQKRWRSIRCDDGTPVRVSNRSICLNGIVYFFGRQHPDAHMDCLVGFDVRMEVFTTARLPTGIGRSSLGLRFMEFNGHVAFYHSELPNCGANEIIFWIFEGFDEGQQPWSCRRITKPPRWEEFSKGQDIAMEGTVPSGELLFRHAFPSLPLSLFYYNLDSKIARLVDVPLPKASELVPAADTSRPESRCRSFITLSHSESIISLKGL